MKYKLINTTIFNSIFKQLADIQKELRHISKRVDLTWKCISKDDNSCEELMSITQAIESTTSEFPFITRQSWNEAGIMLKVFPSNTSGDCFLLGKNLSLGERYNPSREDLIATDWKITD